MLKSEPTTPDKIYIRDLTVRCIIGINPDERVERQDVIISVVLSVDAVAAAASDDIEKTLNYRSLAKDIIRLVETSSYALIESLAQAIADCCLSYAAAREVTVCVDKPGALRFCRSVAVEITRRRAVCVA